METNDQSVARAPATESIKRTVEKMILLEKIRLAALDDPEYDYLSAMDVVGLKIKPVNEYQSRVINCWLAGNNYFYYFAPVSEQELDRLQEEFPGLWWDRGSVESDPMQWLSDVWPNMQCVFIEKVEAYDVSKFVEVMF